MSGSFDPGIAAIQISSSQTGAEVVQNSISSGAAAASGDATKITFSSMGELQAKYPELYKQLIYSWAVQVVQKCGHDNDRYIEELKRQRSENEG